MQIVQISVNGFDNNFSYLVVGSNNEGFLIDPTGSKEAIEEVIKENKAKVVAQLLTHSHPDHCEQVDYFKSKGVKLIEFKDITKKPFLEKEIKLAGVKVKVISTPGHYKDCVCFVIENNIFTGDTLFVKGVGTTAYGGDDEQLESTLQYLFSLDQEMILWPGHNYGGSSSTLKEALNNSHIRPSNKTHEKIKQKVKDYEEKFGKTY